MEWGQIFRELAIGAAGSLIGAVLVGVFGYGWRLTNISRSAARDRQVAEVAAWDAAGMVIRFEIVNTHMFYILKYFIFGVVLFISGFVINGFEPIFDVPAVILLLLSILRIVRVTRLLETLPISKRIAETEARAKEALGS